VVYVGWGVRLWKEERGGRRMQVNGSYSFYRMLLISKKSTGVVQTDLGVLVLTEPRTSV
jgi:hypothetical protein